MVTQLFLIIKYSYQNSMQIAYNTTTWLAQLEEGQSNEWEVVGSNPSWTHELCHSNSWTHVGSLNN